MEKVQLILQLLHPYTFIPTSIVIREMRVSNNVPTKIFWRSGTPVDMYKNHNLLIIASVWNEMTIAKNGHQVLIKMQFGTNSWSEGFHDFSSSPVK